jgi:Tol biopolymer transport system component
MLRETASAGALAFMQRANRGMQLAWYGRDGQRLSAIGEPAEYTTFDLSHDGRRIVTGIRGGRVANLWVIDSDRGTKQRLTLGDEADVDPRWSPDGTRVIFGSNRDPVRSAHIVSLAADTPAVVWRFEGRIYSNDDWSRDGRWLIFHGASVPALMARELDPAGTPIGEPVVVARALTGVVDQAQMSPDGKWVAYNSDESGQFEVYVVPFPATGAKFLVTRGGGSQPTWSAKGDELYYLTPDRVLNGVKVKASAAAFEVGDPFEIARPRLTGVSSSVEQYAPHPSGTRFLVLEMIGDDRDLATGIVLNWSALLR